MNLITLDKDIVGHLRQQPHDCIATKISHLPATVKLALPNYLDRLKHYYGTNLIPDITTATQRSGISCNTQQFGVIICFEQPTELSLHDQEHNLLGDLKSLISEFEVVIIQNGYVEQKFKDLGHRNRFPHLKFHRDRNETQPTPYSLYTRDPRCEEQVAPRQSSTLFIPNIVAYLQCMLERDYQQLQHKGPQSHYDIFYQTDMNEVLGNVVLEQQWNLPEGTGEISMLDNRTTLHASYLRNKLVHGYRIGVRYLK